MLRRAGCSIALLFGLVHAAVAQEIAERPEPKPGDQWFTTWFDYRTGRPAYTSTREVINVTDHAVFVIVRPVKGGEFDEVYTREWNHVVSPIGVYEPHSGLLQFPLFVGKTYPVRYVVTFGKNRDLQARHERLAKVIGWESVEVPAGKFHALKVEIDGTWSRTGASGVAKHTIWWVPAIKRWAKWTYEDRNALGQVFTRTGEELLDYSVK